VKHRFFVKFFSCATILFFSISIKAVTQAFLDGTRTDRVRLGRLARQADELVPTHEANESIIENLETTLDTNFAETWTVIADIQSTVEVVETKVDTLDSDMATSFDGTWTAIDEPTIGRPTLISDADAVGDTITISSSGRYRLSADLTKKIVISVDDVELDLNNYSIVYSTSGQNMISISSNADNIYIHDGTLNHGGVTSGGGIRFEGSHTNCTVERVSVYGAATAFAVITGGENMKFISCYSKNSSNTGFYAAETKNSLIQDCIAESTGRYDFYLTTNSEGNLIKNCTARDTGGSTSGTVIAFRLTDGQYNRIENCLVQKAVNTSSGITNLNGVLLSAGETGSVIINNSIQNFSGSGTDRIRTAGIETRATILTGDDLLASVDTYNANFGNIFDVHWSPDEKYILLCHEPGAQYAASICAFDGSSLDRIIGDTLLVFRANAIQARWSACGHYYALAGDSTNKIEVGDFLGSSVNSTAASINPSGITCITWSPDGKFLATAESDGTVSTFAVDADHSLITDPISTHDFGSGATCIDWSPDGIYIAVGDSSSNVHVYSVDKGYLTFLDSDSTATAAINDIKWSPYSYLFATADAGGFVRIFKVASDTISQTASNSTPTGSVNGVAWSPRGSYLVSGDNNGNDSASSAYVRVYTYNYFTTLTHTKGVDTGGYSVNDVDWSPSGKYIVTVDAGGAPTSEDGTVRVYDAMTICENCSIIGNSIFDITMPGGAAIGILGGGLSQFFANNICYDCETNYSYGIPNIYYGTQNKNKPFDNVSMPLVY